MIAENPRPDRPIGAALSRNLGGPTAPGEKVESELDAFISKRDKQRRRTEGERRIEEAWMESERRYFARLAEVNRREWAEYHLAAADRLRATLGALVAYHEAEAERHLPKGSA